MFDWLNNLGGAAHDLAADHGPALIVFAGTIVGAGWFWQLLARAAEVRREGYATAMKTLVEFQEFPYRIRRRTSDAPDVLAELAGRGHNMQEQLGYWQLWADTEHRVTGELFRITSNAVRGCIKPHVVDAWNQPFVSTAAGMVIATDERPIPYDLSGCEEPMRRFREASRWRFGWRRMLSPVALQLLYSETRRSRRQEA